MATDPTRSVRHFDHPLAFDLPVSDLLERLTRLPAQIDVPYLTVTLNWEVKGSTPARRTPEDVKRSKTAADDGGSDRPALTELRQLLKQMIGEHGPRGDVFDALQHAQGHIDRWIQEELHSSAQGVYIVVHEPTGVFEATGLNLPIETTVALSALPRVYKLMRMVEDHPTYAVLQIDQTDATLSFITHGARDRSVVLESSIYPRKQQSGGLNQSRYQRRADERMEAFARDTLDQVETTLAETGVDLLIMAGNEVMTSVVHNTMLEQLKEVLVDTIRMEPTVTPREKIELTIEIAERAERNREQQAVDRLKNAIGEGGLGVAGEHDTIRKLQNGQVEMLVMCDSYEGTGWADYDMHLYGVGDVPAEHPAGGDVNRLIAVDLREELIHLALATSADVDIIHSSVAVEEQGVPASGSIPKTDAAAELVQMGGVGAVLRYGMTGSSQTSRSPGKDVE